MKSMIKSKKQKTPKNWDVSPIVKDEATRYKGYQSTGDPISIKWNMIWMCVTINVTWSPNSTDFYFWYFQYWYPNRQIQKTLHNNLLNKCAKKHLYLQIWLFSQRGVQAGTVHWPPPLAHVAWRRRTRKPHRQMQCQEKQCQEKQCQEKQPQER